MSGFHQYYLCSLFAGVRASVIVPLLPGEVLNLPKAGNLVSARKAQRPSQQPLQPAGAG